MKSQKRRIRKIVDAFFKTDLPPQLANEILVWFVENRDSEEQQAVLEELWHELVVESSVPDDALKEEFDKLAQLLNFPNSEQKSGKRAKIAKPLRRGLVMIGSMAAMVTLVVGVWFLIGVSGEREAEYSYSAVSSEEQLEVEMVDGTKVVLNKNSEIEYNKRECKFSGEGYFKVPKDEVEFSVKTDNIEIYVLGTEFNLYAYPSEPYSIVTLYSGLLRLEIADSSYTLEAGNELTHNSETGRVGIKKISAMDNSDSPNWIVGGSSSKILKLDEIFDSIESQFGVKIENRDVVNTNHRYSIYFDKDDSIDILFSALQEASGEFRYTIEDDKVILESIK